MHLLALSVIVELIFFLPDSVTSLLHVTLIFIIYLLFGVMADFFLIFFVVVKLGGILTTFVSSVLCFFSELAVCSGIVFDICMTNTPQFVLNCSLKILILC